MYEYIPPQNVKKVMSAVGVSVLGGGALLAVTALLPRVACRWIFQLIAVALFALGIYLYSAYVARRFCYRIESSANGSLDLCVDELRAKGRVTVCRIAVSGISRVDVIERGDKEKKDRLKRQIREEKRKQFGYCAELLPEKTCCLLALECGESLAVTLSYDERLVELLRGNV